MTPEQRIRLEKTYPGIVINPEDILGSITDWYKTKELTNFHLSQYNEPNNLDELVLPLFQYSSDLINQNQEEIDQEQKDLIDNNNSLISKVQSLESNLQRVADAVSQYSILKEDETVSYLWVSNSFNTSTYIDPKSTAFVNTNKGEVTLNFKKYEKVTNYNLELDDNELIKQKALPGSTILLSSVKPAIQTSTSAPTILFESLPTKNPSQMVDNDPTSFFEIEKNYIFKKQKVVETEKAFIADETGNIKDIEKITSDIDGNPLDWSADVVWPSTTKAVTTPVATFVDTSDDSISTQTGDTSIFPRLNATIVLTFKTPTELSILSLAPLIRAGYPNLLIESIVCEADGFDAPFFIAKNREIFSANSLEENNYVIGVEFPIPTSRKITKVTIKLSTGISKKIYFGHPFAWVNIQRRSERNYVFFSSVDYEDTPQRIKIFSTPPILSTVGDTPSGAEFLNIQVEAPATGTVTSSENKGGPLSGLKDIVNAGINTYLGGSTTQNLPLPSVGKNPAFESKKVSNQSTGLGQILSSIPSTIIDKVLDVGSFDRTFTVTDQKVGFDVLAGVRSAIAFSDISVAKIVYQNEGTLFTKEMTFPQRVSTLGLVVEESIPEDWGEGKWIKYFYSIDGQNYNPIEPLKGQSFAESIKLSKPTSSVWLKGVITGNADDPTTSAKILNIAFAGKPL